jgi:hypothetical protein
MRAVLVWAAACGLLLSWQGSAAVASQGPSPAHCEVFRNKGVSAFMQPPVMRTILKNAADTRKNNPVTLGEAIDTQVAGGNGGSFNGRGGGGRWDGRGDGWQGGGQDGRFNGLAYVANSGPRLTNRTVIEEDTGIKFPPALLLDPQDKSTIRFLGGECLL